MFNSNVSPRTRKKEQATDWYCHKCDQDVRRYYTKCPTCQEPRRG
jgi:predicted ATP-dependent serine protease